jgi:lysozyme
MQLSDEGCKFIKAREGLRLRAYQCGAGKWTIGYGTTKDVSPGMEITKEEAEELFLKDILDIEDEINQLIKINLNDNEYTAIVSFIYNIGITRFRTSTLLKLLNQNNKQLVANEFIRWRFKTIPSPISPNEFVKVESKGLLTRRHLEKNLFTS